MAVFECWESLYTTVSIYSHYSVHRTPKLGLTEKSKTQTLSSKCDDFLYSSEISGTGEH